MIDATVIEYSNSNGTVKFRPEEDGNSENGAAAVVLQAQEVPLTNDKPGGCNNNNNKKPKKDQNRKQPNKPNPSGDSKNKDIAHFLRNVKADIQNKDLIPLKILFFFKYATLFVLYPFLILQLKQLGFDEFEAGIINAFIPIVAILGPPLSGIVADKMGNFKILLTIITLLNAPLALILLLVPKAREFVSLPETILFSLGCGHYGPSNSINNNNNINSLAPYNNSFILSSIDTSICTISPNSTDWNDQSNILVQCGHICPYDDDDHAENQPSSSWSPEKNVNKIIESLGQQLPITKEQDSSRVYLLPNGKSVFLPLFYINSVTNINGSKFSSGNPPGLGELAGKLCPNCSFTSYYESLTTQQKNLLGLLTLDYTELLFVNDVNKQQSQGEGQEENENENSSDKINVTNPKFIFNGKFKLENSEFEAKTECFSKLPWKDNENSNNSNNQFKNCFPQCLLEMNRTLFCSNKEEFKTNNVMLSFVMYTIVRVLLGLVSATGFVMFEGAVLIMVKEYGGDYGLQRVSATLAQVIAAPLSGVLLHVFNDFRPAFILYGILQLLSALLTIKINLEFRKPGDKIFGHLKEVLSQIEVLIFFVAMLLSGTAWGYLETFLFWFLESLGGGRILMGLTICIGGLAGIPLLICSRPIIKRFGHVNILSLGLFFFFVRLIGYSYIENPWMCLIFEALEAFTASLAVTAAATYAASLSTEQTIATVQGIWGSLYFGIGRGAGSVIGGYLQKAYNARFTFRFFAIMALIGAILYFIVNILYIKKSATRKVQGMDLGHIRRNKNNKGKDIKETDTIINNGGQSSVPNGNGNLSLEPGTKFDGGYIGFCDANKFTEVPLDEDTTTAAENAENKSSKSNSNGKLKGIKNRLKFGGAVKRNSAPV